MHRRAPQKSTVVVRVTASSAEKIVDQISRDGAAPVEWTHAPGRHMAEQVVSVFSPYVVVFEDLKPGSRIWRVLEYDDRCFSWMDCWTVGRVEGHETVELPAGSFDTIRVTLVQNARKRQLASVRGVGSNSQRTLTIWYSPQAKRAVKITSSVEHRPGKRPFWSSFDLELVSYKLR